MIAFISDIHSNLEALQVALTDIEAQGVGTVVCLGDVLGYGANPKEVMDLVQARCKFTLLGNHDAALLDDQQAFGFNERALTAIDYTRNCLDPELEENHAYWDWLGELVPAMAFLDPRVSKEEVLLVHASPREPLTEYLLPALSKSPEKLQANFEAAAHRLTFFGHTHHPGWFKEGDPFVRATDEVSVLELQPDCRYLINVGSVGQPRDNDPRLCYAIWDGATVRWRRLDYDREIAREKIHQAPDLPDILGDRLLRGR
ncbi:MAG: metallophosphoesterase family protein [Planctomycetota bacterium]|nr:metallophosphoesterase family protein [Planctomycetota bacterium]MDP6941922.1 metallophosphoesterase family protein [Planctomycetota bacterium]